MAPNLVPYNVIVPKDNPKLVTFQFGKMTITVEPDVAFDIAARARAAASRAITNAGGRPKDFRVLARLTDANEDELERQGAQDGTASYLKAVE